MKFAKAIWLTVLHFVVIYSSSGQVSSSDSAKFDYKKIYGFALDGNIPPIFPLLEYDAAKKISDKDKTFKSNFEKRFRSAEDKSDFLANKGAIIDSLLIVFRDYWRVSVLDYSGNYDASLKSGITGFLYAAYPELKGKPVSNEEGSSYIKKYLAGKGLFMTDDIGKTGRLFDLLVWKTQKDTIYTFNVHKETIHAKVVFMDDFITLGWEEYATLGKLYPAGWATKEALYCVRKAYDLSSERFLISYLAHEGRHFEDYKLFPKLKSADLEYRAKLTELSMARTSLYSLIDFFIDNANFDSEGSHQVANYCVIRDLSKALFNIEFEKDKSKWLKVKTKLINKTAYKLLDKNKKDLLRIGRDVEKYIKN